MKYFEDMNCLKNLYTPPDTNAVVDSIIENKRKYRERKAKKTDRTMD